MSLAWNVGVLKAVPNERFTGQNWQFPLEWNLLCNFINGNKICQAFSLGCLWNEAINTWIKIVPRIFKG